MKNLFLGAVIMLCATHMGFSQNVLERAEKRSPKNDRREIELPQEQLEVEQCAFEEVNLRESLLPNATSLEEREQGFKSFVSGGNFVKTEGEIVTIPIVVHIVHIGEAEGVGNNISDEQVYSAITQLNDRFRKTPGTHGDADGVDTEIEFCLASVDPDGNPTSGIVRVDGSGVVGYEEEGICVSSASCTLNELSVKNLSRWPNTDYYNIWVVSEIMDNDGGYGIQGFAYLPGASSLYDGIVIMNTCFGSMGTVNSWNNLGRTFTHEMGHGMGLYHSFNGDQNGTVCPSATTGDYVSDTDPHKRSYSNCPSGTNLCTGNPAADVVHNYMDYSSQTCANMYTQGQADRMNAQIEFFRSSLASSTACEGESYTDLSITSIDNEQSYQCSSTYIPTVVVENNGSDEVTSIDFEYSIDGAAASTYTWNNTLAAGASASIDLPQMTVSFAAHDLEVTISSDSTDETPLDNQMTYSFTSIDAETYGLEVVLDDNGSENSWEILNGDLNVLAFGGPYNDGMAGVTINTDVCIPDACAQFVFYEAYGDGMTTGSYELTDPLGAVAASGWDMDPASTFPTAQFESTSLTEVTTTLTASETEICEGASVTLTAGGGDSYEWSTGATGNSITVSPSNATTYSVTAYDNGCAGNEAMITIDVNDGPTVWLNQTNVTVCSGETVQLIANGAPNYNWSTGQTTSSVTLNPTEDMVISVTGNNGCDGEAAVATITVADAPVTTVESDDITICAGTVVDLIASGGDTYLWNTGATGAEMSVSPSSTTVYEVTASNGSCEGNTVSITVNVEDAPYLGPSVEATFCSSETEVDLFNYLIGADEGGQWYTPNGSNSDGMLDPANDEAGDYMYMITSNGACEDASVVVAVMIQEQPNAGQSENISVNQAAAAFNLINYLNGADAGGSWTDPSGAAFDGNFDPATDAAGVYTYTITASSPCESVSSTISITITTEGNAGQSSSLSICSADPAFNLFPLLIGADLGGTWTGPENSDFDGIFDPAQNTSGDYTYTIGSESATIAVTLVENPQPQISFPDQTFSIGDSVAFSELSGVEGNFVWEFGDGNISNEIAPVHSYMQAGNFNIKLTVEENGCIGLDEENIVIEAINTDVDESYILAQLLVYPNPSAGNFKIKFDLHQQHEVFIEVFNAQGKLVSTTGPERVSAAEYGINLQAQPSGFYYLRFNVDDISVTKN